MPFPGEFVLICSGEFEYSLVPFLALITIIVYSQSRQNLKKKKKIQVILYSSGS